MVLGQIEVLLVEDDEAIVNRVNQSYRESRQTAHLNIVRSLSEAKVNLDNCSYDIAIVDLDMDKGCGTSLLGVNDDYPKLPFIFATDCSDFRPELLGSLDRGVVGLISKNASDLNRLPEMAAQGISEWRHVIRNRRSQQALNDAEARFRDVVETVLEGFCWVGTNDVIQYCNPAFARLLEVADPGTLVGTSLLALVPQESHALVLSQNRRRRAGGGSRYELDLVTAKGNRRKVLISASPRYDGECYIGVLGIIVDFTEHSMAEDERRHAAELRSVRLMAGGVAHDFNNLLAVILGNVNMARTDTPPGDNRADCLQIAEDAVAQAQALTRQLLQLSRGDKPERSRVDIRKIVNESLKSSIPLSSVECVLSMADDLQPAKAAECQIRQMVDNLIINAVQAMPGGGRLSITGKNLTVSPADASDLSVGTYVELVFEDQGVGIEEGELGRIFEPFFTMKRRGTGLGLTTVYSIVKDHGGHISVESEPDRGTAFRIVLPTCRNSASQ